MNSVDLNTQESFSLQGEGIIPIISGTFNALPLYILLFNTLTRRLSLSSRVPAHGPHQYLSLTPGKGMLYATSWGLPPKLWSWKVVLEDGAVGLEEVGSTDITAVSSYLSITNTHIYSMGGPTGEIHARPSPDSTTGFGEKVQEMVYVPEGELAGWDKTNKALRYGTHAIEFGVDGRGYVPDLGGNCIHVHQRLPDGTLEYVAKVMSPRDEDGPRHVVVSKDGSKVYSVTEHTQFLDVYQTTPTGLTHLHSSSLLPPSADPHLYRGDTLRLSPTTPFLFATTRGGTPATKGLLVAFELTPSGELLRPGKGPEAEWETVTSGGKANAIEVIACAGRGRGEEKDWIVLTDGEEGFVMVLGWDGRKFEEVDRVGLEQGDLASHAVWLE